jgi:hypothetical protein
MSDNGKQAKVLRALVLEEAVRRQMDPIVRRAAEAIKLLKPRSEREQSDMRENQIRNVLNVAEESRSVEVVTNFIRYQIGRSSGGRQWQYNGFGLRVIEDIEEGVVAECAEAVGAQAAARIEELGGEADAQGLCAEAYVELTHYYLGYLNRAFYFCDKTETENQDRKRRGQAPLIDDPWAMVARAEEVCQDV